MALSLLHMHFKKHLASRRKLDRKILIFLHYNSHLFRTCIIFLYVPLGKIIFKIIIIGIVGDIKFSFFVVVVVVVAVFAVFLTFFKITNV